MQTGVIMLIDLLAKTAILLMEYATELRRTGIPVMYVLFSAPCKGGRR